MQPFKVVKGWNHIYFSENSDDKQETKDSKRYDEAEMGDAEDPRPYVAVGNAGGDKVKRSVGEVWVRAFTSRENKHSGEIQHVHCRRPNTENGWRSCNQL